MNRPTRKRFFIIVSIAIFTVSIVSTFIYQENRKAHNILMQTTAFSIDANPRRVLKNIENIDKRFLTEYNYMLCDLVKAGSLISMQEYIISDSLLNVVSPYFKYKGDSLRLAEVYYYKGEIARSSNFLLEAIEYFTLFAQHNNNVYDMRELNFYLNNFKGQVYHIKRMDKEEKEAKLLALKLAKQLKKKSFIEYAYGELAQYYARVDDYNNSIPILKEATEMGYSDSIQSQLLFLLSEKYIDNHHPDSAHIYAGQIPLQYPDSIHYLLGRIYLNLNQRDSARNYLTKSCNSRNPKLCFKAYDQLIKLNVQTGSMEGVSHCLSQLEYYDKKVDSIDNKEVLNKIEDVEVLRNTIRKIETEEVEYYKYWIWYFWIMVAAFLCILILLSVAVIQRKKKRDLQLKRQQSRLDALKMQIDPHFIFNNLSILLDLVETGNKAASEYIIALSKIYRYIVSNVDNNLSTVRDELSCLDKYIFLLKIRFGNTIRIDMEVTDEVKGRMIPPIVLQMLLENAIKHNQASEEFPLLIRIYFKDDKIIVENKKKEIASNNSNHHIGLRNIKERYILIGAASPEIYEDETIYRVTLSTL